MLLPMAGSHSCRRREKALDSAYQENDTGSCRHSKQPNGQLDPCPALIPTTPSKMSTEPKKEESEKQNTEDVEVKLVPEGTFGGTIEKPILISKKGEPIPEDTGDQGGGQN
jgi:hypothetical protein